MPAFHSLLKCSQKVFKLRYIFCNDDNELVTAHSVYLAMFTETVLHTIRSCPYKLITCRMSEGIISVLESINIHRNIHPLLSKVELVYVLLICTSVVTPGKFVRIRRITEFLLFVLLFHDLRQHIYHTARSQSQIYSNYKNSKKTSLQIIRILYHYSNNICPVLFLHAPIIPHINAVNFLSYFAAVCSSGYDLCICIRNQNLHSLVNRHIRNYIRNLILLGLVKKAFRLNADLDHFVSRFIPGDRIHHFFSLGSIRRNVLTHGKLLILKHWFKICHLLSGIKAITKIFWHRTAVNITFCVKQMYLIHRYQRRNLL